MKIFYYIGWFINNILLTILGFIIMILTFPFIYIDGYFNPIKRKFIIWNYWKQSKFNDNSGFSFIGIIVNIFIIILFGSIIGCFYFFPIISLIFLGAILLVIFLSFCNFYYITVKTKTEK